VAERFIPHRDFAQNAFGFRRTEGANKIKNGSTGTPAEPFFILLAPRASRIPNRNLADSRQHFSV